MTCPTKKQAAARSAHLRSYAVAVTGRGHVDATAAIYSEHQAPYEASVERLLAAVQAYQAASSDLLKAAQRNAG